MTDEKSDNQVKKRQLMGEVVSTKMTKTVIVEVERLKTHPRYYKRFRFHKRYQAHADEGICKLGDLVIIEEGRPLSKHKRFRVVKVIREAQ